MKFDQFLKSRNKSINIFNEMMNESPEKLY
jgi:hypothetical protein